MIFKGISISEGVAIGKCRKIKENISIEKYSINNIADELERYKKSVVQVKAEIKEIINSITESDDKKLDSEVFRAHLQILEDPKFYKEIYDRIKRYKKNSEWIVKEVVEELSKKLSSSKSKIIKEKVTDIKDVGNRIIKRLKNVSEEELEELSGIIIVTEELTPSQLLKLEEQGVAGIVTEKGGRDSHVAIFCRALEIPAVSGCKNITDAVKENELMVINSNSEEVSIKLTGNEISDFIKMRRNYKNDIARNKKFALSDNKLTDGTKIHISANIQLVSEANKIKQYGINDVGLYRTEFMFMNHSQTPSEEEQYESYSYLARNLEGGSIVIRTLDIGGDKYIKGINDVRKENNPFLGWRGIRISLDRKDLFKAQLKAIYRAGVDGKIQVLFPMISLPDQYEEIKKIIKEVKQELRKEKKRFNENISHGVLIEVPSAVLYMDYFIKEVDFFSIGTNDLLQFLLAVDRLNYRISDLYSWYNRSLFEAIRFISNKCKKSDKPVHICGEIAADPRCLPVFIGLGIYRFSMIPSAVPKIKLLLKKISADDCNKIIKEVFGMYCNFEIKKYLNEKFDEFMGREDNLNEMSEMRKRK
ncbi:MAG: phosphoenolpyruvate--protein phosphotransferase [Candidatus Muiribacteriota bacterium]